MINKKIRYFILSSLISCVFLFVFSSDNLFTKFSLDIQTAHQLNSSSSLNFLEIIIFYPMMFIDKLMFIIDSSISAFPSLIRLYWWSSVVISILLLIPFAFIISIYMNKNFKIGVFILFIFLVWLSPLEKIIERTTDSFIISHKFDVYLPWSKKFIWLSDNKDSKSNYVEYRYSWVQGGKTGDASINISCLGHYKLLVNENKVYDGPVFANLPLVYYDSINVSSYIKKGNNSISVICVFIDGPTHEYPYYPNQAVLIGGKINDGILSHNLSDNRLWEYSILNSISVGERIFDSGYKEHYQFYKKVNYHSPPAEVLIDYSVDQRPTPLLVYKEIKPVKISSGVFDLGRFSTGYLVIDTKQNKNCKVTINYGVNLDNNFPTTYLRQEDEFDFIANRTKFEQISRRSGNYIGINGNCDVDKIDVSFMQVSNNLSITRDLKFDNNLDKDIYNISLNSLVNNVQDHIEDSPEREKATYIGDALQVGKCLMSLGDNDEIVKQTIAQFAHSQNEDGSFPSLSPSGIKQMIPSYSFQWATLLELYMNKTKDKEFAREMWPHLKKLVQWGNRNSSADGFFYNKYKNTNWWIFFDWTPVSQSLDFQTQNQIWYLKSLEVAGKIAQEINVDANYLNDATKLKKNLWKYSYDSERKIFFDSFNKSNKDGISLITNALAGSMGLFPNEELNNDAIDYFNNNYYSQTPYSESWVVDWLIRSGKKDVALNVIRGYWGSMVNDGSTSIYEKYSPNSYFPTDNVDSRSHAWGCGPLYQYKEIFN